MRPRKSAAIFLLCVFSLYEVALPFTGQDADRIVIAFVDFRNTGADRELDYLEQTIPESISTSMAKGGRLEIVERSRLEEALREMEMSQLGIVDEQTAVELGRAVGANAILVGSFVSIGGTLRINARLIDVQTSRVIRAENVQGRVGAEIFDLMDQMALSMEQQMVGEIEEPAPTVVVEPEPEPGPEPVAPVQPVVVEKKKRGGKGLLLIPVIGVAGYFAYVSLLAPADVTVNVNIEP